MPRFVLGYGDGSCLSCGETLYGASPEFDPADRNLVQSLQHGRLETTTVDDRRRGSLAQGGVTAGSLSSRGALVVVRRGLVEIDVGGRFRVISPGKDPVWSPDGSAVAFGRDGHILVDQPSAGRLEGIAYGSDPTWSPDGRQLAFIGADHRVMWVSRNGGRAHRVGDLRGRAVAWGAAPTSTACDPPAGAQTLQTGPDATLYQTGAGRAAEALLGCVSATGEVRVLDRTTLPNEDNADSFQDAQLSQLTAAVIDNYQDQHYGGSSDRVAVYDLNTGRALRSLGGETTTIADAPASMRGLVVNPAGDTAVHTATQTFLPNTDQVATIESIIASDASGIHTIDTLTNPTAAAFDPAGDLLTSLTLTGQTLTWTHDGTPETTQLP